MQIDNVGKGHAHQYVAGPGAAQEQARLAEARAGRARESDGVSVSSEARLLQQAMEAVTETPEARQQRIAALQARIDAGAYQPDAGLIADRLLAFFAPDSR